jgi:hypothetical protein
LKSIQLILFKTTSNNAAAIDSIGMERNKAYYQLGVIYKESLKNMNGNKLEQLLK